MSRKTLATVSCLSVMAFGLLVGTNADAETPSTVYQAPNTLLDRMLADVRSALDEAIDQAHALDELIEIQQDYVSELDRMFRASNNPTQGQVLRRARTDLTNFEFQLVQVEAEIEKLEGMIDWINRRTEPQNEPAAPDSTVATPQGQVFEPSDAQGPQQAFER